MYIFLIFFFLLLCISLLDKDYLLLLIIVIQLQQELQKNSHVVPPPLYYRTHRRLHRHAYTLLQVATSETIERQTHININTNTHQKHTIQNKRWNFQHYLFPLPSWRPRLANRGTVARCARCPWGRDVLPDDDDMDDEDECSTRNFDRVLVATTEITGVAPNEFCARAVFDKICDECEDNIQCYLKLGRQVGPETRECQPRRLKYRGFRYTSAQRRCLSKCYGLRHPRKCQCDCDERFVVGPEGRR